MPAWTDSLAIIVMTVVVAAPAVLAGYLWFRLRGRLRVLDGVVIGAGVLCSTAVVTLSLLVWLDHGDDTTVSNSVEAPVLRTDPIREFIRQRMQPASAAFFAPSPMTRDSPFETMLEIAPPTVDPQSLERELRSRATQDGIAASESIQIAPRMIAALVADRPATIVAKDTLDRGIVMGERVVWRWTVTPHDRQPLTLTATLTAPVVYDGHETGYVVTSFERTVVVTITPEQRVGDLGVWVRDNWVLLAACAAALGGISRWLRHRRTRRRHAGLSPI